MERGRKLGFLRPKQEGKQTERQDGAESTDAAKGFELHLHDRLRLMLLMRDLAPAPPAWQPAADPPAILHILRTERGAKHGLLLVQALVGAAGETLSAWDLFDVYEGPGTPEGMKSLAFAMQFQHAERTLTEAEVTESQDRMVAAVAQGCGGSLRER